MTRIINAEADFSSSKDFILPVAGASYFNIFTGGAAKRNLITPTGTITETGDVDVSSRWAMTDGAIDYLDTGVSETLSMTMVSLCRARVYDGAGVILIGGYDGSSVASVNMFSTSSGALGFSAGVSTPGIQAGSNTETATDWAIRAIRVDGSKMTYDNLTSEDQVEAAVANRVSGPRAIRIGYGYQNTWTGEADTIAAAIYPSYLSDQDLQSVASVMRAAAAKIGVSV